MLKSLALALFICAWAAIAFAIVRALMQLWGFNRRVAVASAVAVAGAFALGAMSPFALPRPAAPPAALDVAAPQAAGGATRAARCPAGARLGTATVQGNIDQVQGAGAAVGLHGWIVGASGPAAALCAIVDGKIAQAAITYGVSRPDVAAALAQPADLPSGFGASVQLLPGTHTITIGAVEADGRTVDALKGAPARYSVDH